MLSVNCPNCGGTNIFDEKKQVPAYCSFCGSHLPEMTTFVKEALKLGLDKQYHNMDMEKMDKEIKKVRVQNSSTKLGMFAIILSIIALIFILVMIYKLVFKTLS